jgi:hypothetical protein
MKDAEDCLLNTSYNYFRNWLRLQSAELAKRSLITKGRIITSYTFRHSAIQYFGELYQWNYTFLANRFGWAYGSVGDRLKDYIARSKVGLPDSSVLARQDEYDKLKEQIIKQQYETDVLKSQMAQLQKNLSRTKTAQTVKVR